MSKQGKAGKVVLVTGASSGLGEAIGLACAEAGHRVALTGRRLDRLEALEERIGRPEQTLVMQSDIRDLEQIREMIARTRERFGRIDALVANAGVGYEETVAESTEEHLLHQVEVNLLGVIRPVREVLPEMLARGSGHILTISSVAADIPSPRGVIYAATKGGVSGFTEGLRREVEPQGLHVTTIQPGFIRTEMTAAVPLPMPPAAVVGRLVVNLLRRPRRRAVVPRYYGFGIWGSRFAPRVADRILAWMTAGIEWRKE